MEPQIQSGEASERLPESLPQPPRIVTAASLFDGHDAAINVMRRLMQSAGAEVIHLGHDRSVADVVDAAVQEDAHAVAVSSYQGGHNEYFRYLVDLLRERGATNIRVFGGGGGVILPEEIAALHDYGVSRIYSPEDGRSLGLRGMIDDLVERLSSDPVALDDTTRLLENLDAAQPRSVARALSVVEAADRAAASSRAALAGVLEARKAGARPAPVLGITGTGGAGKSSVSDELLQRFLRANPEGRVAVLSIDPSRRRTGGALLGDRIRMNALANPRTYMRSMATRGSGHELSRATAEALDVLRYAGFDLVLLESSGTGQADSATVDVCDATLYVMTPEYGAASQLEKIDLLDYADFVVINKFDRAGAEDAIRDVRKQVRRNRELFDRDQVPDQSLPVFGTIASQFNDPAVSALYDALAERFGEPVAALSPDGALPRMSPGRPSLVPPQRVRYLAEIADTVRAYHLRVEEQAEGLRDVQALRRAAGQLDEEAAHALLERATALEAAVAPEAREALVAYRERQLAYQQDEICYSVRGREIRSPATYESLAGTPVPRVVAPTFADDGDALRFAMRENLPGYFPYTAGVFPLKRGDELPTRQFAGEGPPERTNRRFHLLSRDAPAKRLSTAFDSVTLYGADPDERPDIWGKVGESGVSVATLDDMKRLYEGFDLCAPNTSVSMTINGPAPVILAMFLNTAVDQQLEAFREEKGRDADPDERAELRQAALRSVRGTVQADILKEDQAQNTCIFSTEFALKMMGDIQQFLIDNECRNYYSVSISGYHIAEAGANPITQLAFTLANGFTYVEAYRARGMDVDAFARNLSFFFSNGLDPEYTVIGRVARRIWAVALRDLYGAGPRAQKLKYHIQTSGRSLHAQEIAFNDIRTTLQALLALQDNSNSLHTNAYDEAITTPTDESVRRALAVQLINQKEFGWLKNENPLQGSYFVDWLTDRVEEAVLDEFERLAQRGGVLGAMERQYQRSRIQEESLLYEERKHSGELPIVGVNTFTVPGGGMASDEPMEVTRATVEEKEAQISRLRAFQGRHAGAGPAALEELQRVALAGGNIFECLMETVRVASLGQITDALFAVGGRYRRAM
jgi:methylmalonyl-CoA mutase